MSTKSTAEKEQKRKPRKPRNRSILDEDLRTRARPHDTRTRSPEDRPGTRPDGTRTRGGTDPGAQRIKAELDRLDERLKEAEAAYQDLPTPAEIDALIDQVKGIRSSVEAMPGEFNELLKAIDKRVDDLATAGAAAGMAAGKGSAMPRGMRQVAEQLMDTATYKAMFDADGKPTVQLAPSGAYTPKTQVPSLAMLRAKSNLITIDNFGGSNLEYYRPTTVVAREWAMGVQDMIPSQIVRNAKSYVVPRETVASRYGAWTSTLTVALDGEPTPKSEATLAEVNGLMKGSILWFVSAAGVTLGSAQVLDYNTTTKVVTFVTNSLTWDAAIGDRVVSANYSAIPEGGTKPEAHTGTDKETFDMRTLPSIFAVTQQALNTIEGLTGVLERKLPYHSRRNKSRHLIYGDGTAEQLQGLRTYAGAQAYLWSEGVTGDNRVDAILRAINLIPWGVPISVLMNQQDLLQLLLLKGSDGHYLVSGSFGTWTLTIVGGRYFIGPYELVFDYAVEPNDFTVINFEGASEIGDQDTASLMWGWIDQDFYNNIIRLRYEETLTHAILDPNEFVVCEWDSAPSA